MRCDWAPGAVVALGLVLGGEGARAQGLGDAMRRIPPPVQDVRVSYVLEIMDEDEARPHWAEHSTYSTEGQAITAARSLRACRSPRKNKYKYYYQIFNSNNHKNIIVSTIHWRQRTDHVRVRLAHRASGGYRARAWKWARDLIVAHWVPRRDRRCGMASRC